MKRSISLASHNHKIINAISIHQETRAKRYYYRNRANLHSNKFHCHYLTSVSLSNPKYSTINSNCLLSINSWQSGPLIGDDYTLQVALPSAPLESGGNARGGGAGEEGTRGRTCYSSDDLKHFLIQTKRSWGYGVTQILGSLADGHNLSGLVAELAARGLGLTYNNRSCSRVQWLDSA